ncbi:hypothetical protein BC829DRAFT_123846 [Chytridium lagenaria]|nr:hypothetical protein BC829DRAFT_123846 [Chytridium lagenaria]
MTYSLLRFRPFRHILFSFSKLFWTGRYRHFGNVVALSLFLRFNCFGDSAHRVSCSRLSPLPFLVVCDFDRRGVKVHYIGLIIAIVTRKNNLCLETQWPSGLQMLLEGYFNISGTQADIDIDRRRTRSIPSTITHDTSGCFQSKVKSSPF